MAFFLYRVESRRDAEAARQLKAQQASKVAAWFGQRERERNPAVRGLPMPPFPELFQWGAYVRNASDMPIFDLVCTMWPTEALDDTEILEPTDEPVLVLPPNETIFVESPASTKEPFTSASRRRPHAVSLTFRDSSNTRWIRDEMGVLKER